MIEEAIKNNLDELDEIFEDFEDEIKMPQADAEILGGIMVDIEKGIDSSTTVKNVIAYLMRKNDIDGFNGNNVRFELKDNEVVIIKQNGVNK